MGWAEIAPIWTATDIETFKNTYTFSYEANFTMMENMEEELEVLLKGTDEGCIPSCTTTQIKVIETFTSESQEAVSAL